MLIDFAITGGRNVVKKEADNVLKYKDLTIAVDGVWNIKRKYDTCNNWDNRNHLKTIQKIPEQHTEKV